MKKKIKNIRIELNCFGINTDKITLAEAIFDQISDFVSDKVKEIAPEVDPQVRISKDYEYQKEATDETW